MKLTWMEYSTAAEPLTQIILEEVQDEFGVQFPKDFVDLMMEHQGMIPEEEPYLVHSNRSFGALMYFDTSAPFGRGTIQDFCRGLLRNEYPKGLIPFSATGGQPHYALDFRESTTHPSVVYVFSGSAEEPWVIVYIASSITDLLSQLRPNSNFYNIYNNLYGCDRCGFETRVRGPVEPEYFYKVDGGGSGRRPVDFIFAWCHSCEDIRPVEDFSTEGAYYKKMVPLAVDKPDHKLEQGEFGRYHLLKYRDFFENTSFKPRCLSCFTNRKEQEDLPSTVIAIHTCGGQIHLKDLSSIEIECETMRIDYPWTLPKS